MADTQTREFESWLEANQKAIWCLSMAVADFTFSAAASIATFGDKSGYWLKAAWDGAQALGDIMGCFPPPYEEVEDYAGVTVKQCQCAESAGQLMLQYMADDGHVKKLTMSGEEQAKKIKSSSFADNTATCVWETVGGEEQTADLVLVGASSVKWYIVPVAGTDCCAEEPAPLPPIERPEPYQLPPIDKECPTNVQLLDSCVDKYGLLQNFYVVSDGGSCYPLIRFWYWTSITGPIVWVRTEGDRETFEGFVSEPMYGPPHRDAPQMPTAPGGGGVSGLNPVTYKLDAGCTWNEETDEYNTTTYYNVEQQDDGILGLARRMDELAKMINDSGLIKYTTCGREQKLQGDPVTIAWISEEASSDSPLRLRKRTGYRTNSDRDSKQLQEYFADFTWEAGPVCVGHKGARWGNPQVWASTEEEGKRVLRHIAGEAGLNPDQVGRWTVGGSHNARYGMTGTMRVRRIEGIPWVSRRQGPNMLPM